MIKLKDLLPEGATPPDMARVLKQHGYVLKPNTYGVQDSWEHKKHTDDTVHVIPGKNQRWIHTLIGQSGDLNFGAGARSLNNQLRSHTPGRNDENMKEDQYIDPTKADPKTILNPDTDKSFEMTRKWGGNAGQPWMGS